MAINTLFASKSIAEHAVRGAIGISALYGAAFSLNYSGILPLLGTIAGLALGLVALRGCPFCWSIGLINTVFNTMLKSKNCQACNDITTRKA